MTATERLRALLDERGVEWGNVRDDGSESDHLTEWEFEGIQSYAVATEYSIGGGLSLETHRHYLTPEQAIAATLGREQRSDPVWEQWREGLRHDEVKTIGDAVEQLMYEVIEFGGDMGPNGNTCGCIDEGEVATLGFINSWIEKFEATLGNDGVERTKNGVDERGTCHDEDHGGYFVCSECGAHVQLYDIGRSYVDKFGKRWYATSHEHGLNYCPNCGRKVVDE